MKKKLLSILLITATLLCFGCGGGSSSATNGGNSGDSANIEANANQTNDSQNIKKTMSATYTYYNPNLTYQTGNSYPMTLEINDDESYTATIERPMDCIKYYFTANGIITKKETYYSGSSTIKDTQYFVNGVSADNTDDCGLGFGDYFFFYEFRIKRALPNYDEFGNITNKDKITESDENVDKSTIYSNKISYGDLIIERDESGRISKTSTTGTGENGYTYLIFTDCTYSDNSISMNSWQTHIASDGKTISVFYGGLKVTYTSQGSISEVVFLGEDGTESDTKYIYNYNDNGYLTSITQTKTSGWSSEFVTIEYTN